MNTHIAEGAVLNDRDEVDPANRAGELLAAFQGCAKFRVFSGGEVELLATPEQLDVVIRKLVRRHAARLLQALDAMDLGCREPGFQGHENGYGDSGAGDELQAAREELAAFVGSELIELPRACQAAASSLT